MKILVTGGQGFVGSKLVPQLLAEGHNVISVDIGWFGDYLPDHRNLIKIQSDVRDLTQKSLGNVDSIIHLAAIANDPLSDLHPSLSWEIGCLGTNHLLNLCILNEVKHFIYASSGSVYGLNNEMQVTENSNLVPISLYNKVKMVTERLVLSYAKLMKVTLVRPATICGISPRMRLDLAVNALTMSALEKKEIHVDGGSQTRPNVHIDDVCDAYKFFLEDLAPAGVYNLGFENLTLKQLAELVNSRIPSKIIYNSNNDPRSYRLNSDKILSAGFKPKRTVVNAIEDIEEAYSKNLLKNLPNWHSTKFLARVLSL